MYTVLSRVHTDASQLMTFEIEFLGDEGFSIGVGRKCKKFEVHVSERRIRMVYTAAVQKVTGRQQ